MRTKTSGIAAAVIFVAAFAFIMAVASYAHGVKPPSARDRAHNSQSKYEWSDLKPGKKAYTKGGKFCECGVSSTDPNTCYYPKPGQYCCNPKTGECRMLKLGDVNTPWK